MNPAQFPKSLLSPVIRDHLTKQSNQQYPPSSFLIITESKPAIRNSDELLLPHPGGFSPWFPPPEKRPLWIAGRWTAQPKRIGRARPRAHTRTLLLLLLPPTPCPHWPSAPVRSRQFFCLGSLKRAGGSFGSQVAPQDLRVAYINLSPNYELKLITNV